LELRGEAVSFPYSCLAINEYAQSSDTAPSLQRQSIARSGDSGRLLRNESAQHRGVSERHPRLSCRAFPSRSKISENVTILGLPWIRFAPHIVCPQGRIPSILLLTVIDDF